MTAPAKTVWLFEVIGNRAEIQEHDEGVSSLAAANEISAVGDGTIGGIIDVAQVAPQQRRTRYAMGKVDNADPLVSDGSDGYQSESARHRGGTNYLAMDGHAVYLTPEKVSAGGMIKGESLPQAGNGCPCLNPAFVA